MDTNTYLIKRILNTHIVVTILITLTATVNIVINSMIAGQMLGADALIAIGFATPLLVLMSAVSGIFSNGGNIRCAKHMGAGDMRKVSQNFTAITLVTVIMGLLFTAICLLGKDAIAGIFGAQGNIKVLTATYIMGIGISALPFMLQQNILLYIRMDNDQKLALVSMAITIAVNTAFALWSCSSTDLGILGIALSIFFGSIIGLMVTLIHFRRKGRMLRLCSIKGNGPEIKQIVLAGIPTAINRGSITLKSMILNVFLVAFSGNVAVLALSVQNNVYQFMIAISMGYGLVVAMMCGLFYGERDERAISDTIKVTIKSGFIVSLIAGTILFIFAEQVAKMFITGDGDLSMTVDCLRFFALSQPTSTVCFILIYMYQTMGNLPLSAVISITRGVGYVVLISILFAPIFGLNAVWASFFIADVLSIATISVIIWVKKGTFPRHLDDYILAPKGAFDVKVLCDISVRNDVDEILGLGKKIESVFEENGIDRRKTERISLCIEEMACNVVDHAFNDDKEHFIDIRIIQKEEDIIFRMRDDGRPFNPLTADTDGHLGIKVVRAAAKNIDYRYSVKLNNLTVTV